MSRRHRRHRHDDHVNHEAWAIPYADLMTLLLAFFVVMYAVSVVNEGKYRVMSRSLIQAFNGSSQSVASDATKAPVPARPPKAQPQPEDALARRAGKAAPVALPLPTAAAPQPVKKDAAKAPADDKHSLANIEKQVASAMQPLIDKKLVTLRRNKENWLEIEIRNDVLFPSGVAQLSNPAQGVLHSLAGVLAGFDNPLRIEGFTDDVPINTALYPSNWELSAARAGSVARLFVGSGIAQDRMGIVGWGEMRPVADNSTAEGRSRNRRVLVVVMGNGAQPMPEQSSLGALARQPGAVTTPALPTVQAARPAPAASAPRPAGAPTQRLPLR